MPNHEEIYSQRAELYELMISKQPRLEQVIANIRPFKGLDIVDLGAGTGRLTTVLAKGAKSIIALDASEAMLAVAEQKLKTEGLRNWEVKVADHRQLPLADQSVDLIISGWSICYLASTSHQAWKSNLAEVMSEIGRVLRRKGTTIFFETMGTGTEQPDPPSFLRAYYEELEKGYGFQHKVIRMDYHFDSPAQAAELIQFFFGDELAAKVKQEGTPVVKEYAGVWWRHY